MVVSDEMDDSWNDKIGTHLVVSVVLDLLGGGELRVGGLGCVELAQRPLALLILRLVQL